MDLSILSFKTINKLKPFFKCSIPMPQDAGTPSLSLLQIFNLYIISIAVLENVPPRRRVSEKSHLFHTNLRSGWDQGSNPGHLRGRQRRKTLSHPPQLRHYVNLMVI
jgi:hypothetical protein